MPSFAEFPISAADYATVAEMMCPGQRYWPPGQRTITVTPAGLDQLAAMHGEPMELLLQHESRVPLALISPELEVYDLGHVRALYRRGGARVWLCWDGAKTVPTGSPHAEVSLDECTTKLGLTKAHYHRDLATLPSFGAANDALADVRGPQHVVVEVTADEAARHRWKPGFYLAPVTPEEILALYGGTVPPRAVA